MFYWYCSDFARTYLETCRVSCAPLGPQQVCNISEAGHYKTCRSVHHGQLLSYLSVSNVRFPHSNVYSKARRRIPYLRRYARDWATAECVRLTLKNTRGYDRQLSLTEDVALNVSNGITGENGGADDDQGGDDDFEADS